MKFSGCANTLALFGGFLALLLLILPLLVWAEADYERARRAYEKGDDVVARLYFKSILDDPDRRPHHASALYFLTKICDHEGDFVGFVSAASRFLVEYENDLRTGELFSLLLERLVAKRSYYLALEYLKEYDYLVRNDSLLEKIAYGLSEQGEKELADYVFSLCPQSDTVKVIRALLKDDLQQREKIFTTLEIPSKNLYLIENHLMTGDTISAFLEFLEIELADLSPGGLYKLSKLALLFDRAMVSKYTALLRKHRDYHGKAELLRALAECDENIRVIPKDQEEIALHMQLCQQATIEKEAPSDLALDSLLGETDDTLNLMRYLADLYDHNYYIDSLYCESLLDNGRYRDAERSIYQYSKYCNTQSYVRKVFGLQNYMEGDYAIAAINIIISGYRSPPVLYVLAECLRHLGREAGDFYEQVMAETTDSILQFEAVNGYVSDRYAAEDFQALCGIDPDDLQGDTTLVMMYARSLTRCGRKEYADSIYYSYLSKADPLLPDLYGQYLMEKEEYESALVLYDSLFGTGNNISDGTYYNWALAAFLNNEMDSAYERFSSYMRAYPQGSRTRDAFFKIATMNYLKENFDSAAYYYGLASEDDALMADALRNKLISYKKDGDWTGVISTGQEMLESCDGIDQADVLFDIGYAFLRTGRIKEAVQGLLRASRMGSDPRFYYWLGEAYLSKGDFARAYHSYRRVIDEYGDDEMWAPTAYYKTGIVLEFMDEIEAARSVYEQIVKQRGTADPIGAEANARLEQLQQ
jgi:TolA-binding protein